MKINRKLGILSLLIVSSLLSLIVFSFIEISNLSKDISKNRNVTTPLMIDSLILQKDIIQIQQWLTDISATRGKPGFDDGFDEAKIYYDDAISIINGLKKYNVDEELIDELKSSLDDYYSVGIDMANTYIQSGTDEGNIHMEIFDPFAEEIQEEANKLITDSQRDRATLTKNINKSITKLRYMSAILSLIVLIITLSSIVIIKKSVLNRLNKFVEIFKNISQGDGDLTSRIDEESNDELGQVSMYFNSFIERIHDMMILIKSMGHETNSSAEATSIVANELILSIGEVAVTTNNVSEQTAAQAETVKKVIENINQNNEQIHLGVESINESVELAKTARQLTEVGFNAMRETMSSFEIMESDINVSRDEINNLEKSVNEIGIAIDIITNISYQINLLSLNASIEAARAGEHGKGFSVVSTEIGVLAEETKQATEKISKLLENVQSDTKKTVMSMDLNVKNITSQRDVLSKGSNSIEETNRVNILNSEKIFDISSIFNDIDRRLNELTEMSQHMLIGADSTRISSEEVAESIEEQLSALEEVTLQMNSVKESSTSLNIKLDEFIV